MGDTTIPAETLRALLDPLGPASRRVSERFPGDAPGQPVHTVYGGAHLFKPDTVQKLGDLARRTLDAYAHDADTLAAAFGIDGPLAARLYPRLVDKLRREPVEDFRIDFEDGFGSRLDEEEDRFAGIAARQVAEGLA